MPTENRSSNREMVSVPREHELKIRQTPLADLLSGLKTGEIRDCSDREFAVGDTVLLREIDDGRDYTGTVARRTITHVQKHYGLPDHLCVLSYGQPAPQPHPEPIAWMVGTAFWWTKEEADRDAAETGLPIVGLGAMTCAAPAEQRQGEPVALPAKLHPCKVIAAGWNQCLDVIGRLGPLYTHADPGEVERLRDLSSKLAKCSKDQLAIIEDLRAQLTECEAMAAMIAEREWAEHVGTGPVSSKVEAAFTQLHNDLHEAGEKLAERDALLRDFLEVATGGFSDSDHVLRVRRRLETFLSASAEPQVKS